MSPKRSKALSEQDRELWSQVVRSTKPLNKGTANRLDAQLQSPKKKPFEEPHKWQAHGFEIGQKSKPQEGRTFQETPVLRAPTMDSRKFKKMRRGKFSPEARIDLHGMTLEVAHPALIGFVLKSYDSGKRLLLVITGKGRNSKDTGPIPQRGGILRRNVPHWLCAPPLASLVLEITPAHNRHGGEGAFYVYLRRR